ncbi:MAG: phosphate ABC transporter substrate-binding protein PstS [Candidatus Methylomirabilales bacterium]
MRGEVQKDMRSGALWGLSLMMAGIVLFSTPARADVLINGAGATFPFPIYSKWFWEYRQVDPSVKINYQSIGSGGGVRQIIARTVDFGASDAPVKDEDLRKAPGKLLHIPTVIGAVVVIYNMKGVGKGLNLTPSVLADIFLGRITQWNDARLARLNPALALPAGDIIVVHRSDGSGTTSIFTDYLSSVSPEWKKKVGQGKSVRWPVGLGGKGNEGVAGQVKNTRGTIGYVELAYADQNQLPYASIQNQAGNFVKPGLQTTSAAAAGAAARMPSDFRISLVNQRGNHSYPIASFTWILLYQDQRDCDRGQKVVEFLWWAIHEGQRSAPKLLYAPLPDEVVRMVEATLKTITCDAKPVLTSR